MREYNYMYEHYVDIYSPNLTLRIKNRDCCAVNGYNDESSNA